MVTTNNTGDLAKIWKAIIPVCHFVETIHLGDCYIITDNAVVELVKRCPKLREIGLSGCTKITGKAVMELATRCPYLEVISLLYFNHTQRHI